MRKEMKRLLVTTALLVVGAADLFAQVFTFSGYVYEKNSGEPVEFATVVLEGTSQWAVADAKGFFSIKNVSAGKNTVEISSLGYVSDRREISISKDITNYKIYLSEDNLTLESVVVTAKQNDNSAATSRTIDKTALDHVQVLNVADITSLLPGGATPMNNSLTSDQTFAIRGAASEDGNASFGTAVEVDGVRLSNNASFSGGSSIKGATTNNIASSNVESVEVITGVPSVEYGDMTSGVVKINTRKGKTPWTATLSTTPKNKQFSLSKGFGLGSGRDGASRGVINASAEYTKSISEPMSPYTSYSRKQLSLTYSNLFQKGIFEETPLRLSASLTGNLGGLDNSADPDLLKDTYTRTRDNALRANLNLNWLLNKSWITNLELNASLSYTDKLQEQKEEYSSTTSAIEIHGTEKGYYMPEKYNGATGQAILQLDPGYWYNTMYLDDKPLNAKITLKATWAKNFGKLNSKLKLGADLSGDKNFGVGQYTEDLATAPTFREYRYCDVPWMTGVSPYLEENLMIPVGGDGRINLIAGVRNDNTIIRGSAYGTTSSVSPRFNAKYTVFTSKGRRHKFVKELSFRGGWGLAVKQPSFSILYPQPSYYDINVFTSTVDANNAVVMGYYIMPRSVNYNPALRFQKSSQSELGVDMTLGGTKISLAAYYSETLDTYRLITGYDTFRYNYTGTTSVQGMEIPAERRVFSFSSENGTVTVSDRDGILGSVQAPYTERNQFISNTTAGNAENPVRRYGLEWVVEFPKIEAISTSVRIDGSFYNYLSRSTDLVASCPTNDLCADGSMYRYVGWYYGDSAQSNGSQTRTVRNNVTLVTHIPQVRLIFSFRLESSLLKYSRSLSDRLGGGKRSYVLTDRNDYLSYDENASIYDGDCYAVLFPDYYSTIDEPSVLRDFLTDFKWAAQNDRQMYRDLSKLVKATSYTYIYKDDYITPYFCLNFSVTKEIGDIASLSFYANNFINASGQLYSTRTGTYSSLSSYIPAFYYGLTARFKF